MECSVRVVKREEEKTQATEAGNEGGENNG